MTSYFILISTIYFLFLLSKTKNQLENKLFYISILILFCFAAFRGNGDVDYFRYKEYSQLFTTLNSALFEHGFLELGFRLLSYFVNVLGLDSQVVIIVMNGISISAVGYVLYKISDDKMLSVLLFLPLYFQLDMHSARTAVAASLGLLSFYHLAKRDYLYYGLSVLGAFLFHKSALVLLVPLPFTIGFVSNLIEKYISIIVILGLWLVKHFVSIVQLMINFFTMIRMDNFALKIERYSQSKFGKPFSLFDPRLLLALFVFFAFYYIYRTKKIQNVSSNIKDRNHFNTLVLIYSFLGALFYIGLSDITILTVRVSHFFNMITLITIPIIIHSYKVMFNKYQKDGVLFGNKQLLFRSLYISFIILYLGYTLIVLPKVPYHVYLFGLL